MGSFLFLSGLVPNSKEWLRPLHPSFPPRADPYGQAISVSDGQSLSLRPVFASKLGFAPDARLRLTIFGDEPLDGTNRPAYLHTKCLFGGNHSGCKCQLQEPHFALFSPRSAAMSRKKSFLRTSNLAFLPAEVFRHAGRFATEAPPPNKHYRETHLLLSSYLEL